MLSYHLGADVYVAIEEYDDEDEQHLHDVEQDQGDLESEEPRIPSDVPDQVYWDDTSLVQCWESALLDFKVRFLHSVKLHLEAAH